MIASFNPSRGIAIIQTRLSGLATSHSPGFNPSRGIAIIQTDDDECFARELDVSIPHAG